MNKTEIPKEAINIMKEHGVIDFKKVIPLKNAETHEIVLILGVDYKVFMVNGEWIFKKIECDKYGNYYI